MRIAYLTNAYPKVSHSFIRREIAALEQLGVEVLRLSVRATRDALPDAEDRAELEQTIVLLDGTAGMARIARATLVAAIAHPLRFGSALSMALAMARAGGAGVVRHLAYLAEACRLSELLVGHGIGHVHVHFGTNPAAVARLARVLSGISYSMTVHGPDEFDAPRGLSLREKIADSSFTAGVSSYGRSQLMRWADVADWPRIGVVRCGVDRAFLDHPPVSPPNSRRLVCVARLGAQKGLPLLLEAAAELVAAGQAFELRIIGDGELRPVLERQIEALGLGRQVALLGWRSGDEVLAELRDARAFILPSFAEGLPVVLMEAMALHKPVITTAIAGIPELVDDKCGWVVPAGSVTALVGAMSAALEADEAMRAAMGKEGHRRVVDRHDADRNAASLHDALQASPMRLIL